MLINVLAMKEPSQIEEELAIEKVKRLKATGVDHAPFEQVEEDYSKKYINS
jgi:hypothetical protein